MISKIKQTAPMVDLLINNGSERGDFIPFDRAIELLGRPHTGTNLMACYYPKNSNWPKRKLFDSEDVPHYRWGLKDETEKTKLPSANHSTDGYYNLDLADPENEVVKQIVDARRFGHDVTLTLTADCDTPEEDLIKIAKLMNHFGVGRLRLNHEANGNTWFRFAKQVGNPDKSLEEETAIYKEISDFFITAHGIFKQYAPEMAMVACYNGPGELINMGKLEAGVFPNLENEQLGPMYKLPATIISLDQYGSLHYGWPGHIIEDVPVVSHVTHDEHRSFYIPPGVLCEKVFRAFRNYMAQLRGEADLRINLGELDYDQDIHGPDKTAELILECYEWIRDNPDVIESVVHYTLADRGGLGLFVQKEYGNTFDLTPNAVTEVYKHVMNWDVFKPAIEILESGIETESVNLSWTSSKNATGIEIKIDNAAGAILDFKKEYWKRVVFVNADNQESFIHSVDRTVNVPANTKTARVFALPPDGRNNADGELGSLYKISVPMPGLVSELIGK